MIAGKHSAREHPAENQPQRTLLLFGLSPVQRLASGSGRHPSGAYIHADPDRLLLPITNENLTTPDELSTHEMAEAMRSAGT